MRIPPNRKESFFLLLCIAVAIFIIAAGVFVFSGSRAIQTGPVSRHSSLDEHSPISTSRNERGVDAQSGFDRRDASRAAQGADVQHSLEERQQAAARLREMVPGVEIDFDQRLGSPRFIASTTGFLTGPNGEGDAVPAGRAGERTGDGHREVKSFIAEHSALFGHGPELLDAAKVSRDYVTAHNGLRTTVWQQTLDGVRVFESTFQANVTNSGELVNVSSRLVPDVRAAAERGSLRQANALAEPPVGAPQAINKAAEAVGDPIVPGRLVPSTKPEGESQRQSFRAPGLLDLATEYVWLPIDEGMLRLCWEVVFMSARRGELFRTLVDAETGEALLQHRLTEYISPASYRVFTSDSPTPMSPGHVTPLTTQPPAVARELITLDAVNTTASPNGWINDGVMETRGNNVDAHLDVNADNVADTPRPQAIGEGRVFDPALDLSKSPSANRDAAVVNLFYWTNLIHDRFYALGFTEAAGNFQLDNFGRGGLGNDALQADVQDGANFNRSSFSTPIDGSAPKMTMYLFTEPSPARDGALDQETIIHEYTHGLSNRLVGGGVGITDVQSRGLGEGWSDFYALSLLSEPGDDPHGTYAFGAYTAYQLEGVEANYYYGLRRYPYSTDLLKNPLTFKDIVPEQASIHAGIPKSPRNTGTADQVQNQGEVWCATLWDARANLIAKHGAVAGNELILRLVTDGMKLAPANPTFIQARNAILQADLVYSGGANHKELWMAFAKRGMGVIAKSLEVAAPVVGTTPGVYESFDVPDVLSVTPFVDASSTGSLGGPFSPSKFAFSLSNSGAAVTTWTAAISKDWLTLSRTSGTLAPDGRIEIEATLNAAAATLPAGNHTAVITFTNLISGAKFTRNVSLQVDYLYEPLFTEDFESPTLDPSFWTLSGTGPYRTRLTTGYAPHSGLQILGMDSSMNGTSARNEATLTLNPAGRRNLVLRFWQRNYYHSSSLTLPASPFIGGENFDGVAISLDGTTWYKVHSPGVYSSGPEWKQFTVDLDAALAMYGLTYGPTLKIRFNHYGYSSLASGGCAFDDISVSEAINRRLSLNIASSATEGGPGINGTVNVTPISSEPVTISLASSDPTEASVPATVVIPAGTSSAAFSISTPDDAELDGTQLAAITASAATFISGSATLAVNDSEVGILTLEVPPTITEGDGTLTGTVKLNAAPAQPVRVLLSSGSPSDLLVPDYVDIPAGQTSAPFTITVINDTRLDGTVNVPITAHVDNWANASATISVADNEAMGLTISAPVSMAEGDGPRSGTISVAGTLASDLVVSLSSSDTTEATVPAAVTINAGKTSATFAITVVDDLLQDGIQSVTFTGSAAGLANGILTVSVADNDVHHFDLSPIASPQIRNAPVAVTVTARDINGEVMIGYLGSANFNATGETGPLPCSPLSSTAFTNGIWTGSVSIGAYAISATLTASAGGVSVTSNPFAVTRGALDHFGWSPIDVEQGVDKPIAVTVNAQDAGGNLITEFVGPVLLGVRMQAPRAPTGMGTGTSTNGFSPYIYRVERVQCIYTPAEIGGAGRLTGLGFNITQLPSIPLQNFTVRVKHTNLAAYSVGATWEDSDWTVVYQGTTSFTKTGWVDLPFSIPFHYDGTSNLMLDFSYRNRTQTPIASSSGAVQSTTVADVRKIWSQSSSSVVDPLSWTGNAPSPIRSTVLPNVRFTSFLARSSLRPAFSQNFSGGTWSGNVSVPFASSVVRLEADDSQGHSGLSNEFATRPVSPPPGPGVRYVENFEKGMLSSAWTVTGNGSFRTQVTTANGAHLSAYHLTLDATYYSAGRNEATWTVDLAGLRDLELRFWAKGFLDSPHGPPATPFIGSADFDGVAISEDGVNWFEIQPLRSLSSTWTQFTVSLDDAIRTYGLKYNSSFKIRFNQYDSDPIPNSGIAIDDIEIVSQPNANALQLALPAQLTENGSAMTGVVTLPFVTPVDTIVALENSAPAKVTLPSQVTIDAGQKVGYFQIQPLNDFLIDGSKTVAVTATSPHFPSAGGTFIVADDDIPGLSVSVPSTTIVEGASVPATITLTSPSDGFLALKVTSSDPTAVSVSPTFMVPPGATTGNLSLTGVNDDRVDGTQTATISVAVPGGSSQSVTLVVTDNESNNLRLDSVYIPDITTFREGSGQTGLYVRLPGTLSTATTVSFSSSAPSKIAPPPPVSIPAGNSIAGIAFTVLDDNLADPDQSIVLTASAEGFNPATYTVTFQDNDPHHFTISPIASPQVRGGLIPVTVAAEDANGNTLTAYTGAATLNAGGLAIQPALLSGFVDGVWTGSIRVNELGSNIVLTVADPLGHQGTSNPFDTTVGPFHHFAWDPIPPEQRPQSNIPVSVRSVDAGGTFVPAVDEPITVRALAAMPTLTVGAGTTTDDFVYSFASRSRAEVLYFSSELGGPRRIAGIALNLDSGNNGQVLKNWTIRLKATSLEALYYGASWESEGWTVVHRSNQTLTSTGWITFMFDAPFEYDGLSNLLVDFSYNNDVAPSPYIIWKVDYSGSNRVLYGYSNSAPDPVTWSGTTPSTSSSSYLPQTRFLELKPAPANIAASPSLNAGIWSDSVSFAGTVERIFLEAVDAFGRRGLSNAIRVTSATPSGNLPFSDGFETGAFSNMWTLSTTGSGRGRVLSTNSPHTGSQHAVLDGQSGYSARTELTLSLDLIGYSNVTLNFWAKRFGGYDEGPPSSPFLGGADFDGVAMSADGTNWYEIQPLRGMTKGVWTQFNVNLSAAIAARGLAYTSTFKIRFNHYGYDTAPSDGLAVDGVTVTGNPTERILITTPAFIAENAAPFTGSVAFPSATGAERTVFLLSSSPRLISVPASVVVPAGQTSASFTLTPHDNAEVAGALSVNISATSSGWLPASASVQVSEDDVGALGLSVPSPLLESSTDSIILSLSPPPVGTVTVALTYNLPDFVQMPSMVTIGAEESSISIPITLVNNYTLHGTQSVTFSAAAANWTSASATALLNDDENPTLFVNNATVWEGTNSSLQIIPGATVSSDTIVSLSSSDPARFTVPATAIIPSGSSSVYVSGTAVENSTLDGPVQVIVTASAQSFASYSATVTVNDNDPHRFLFGFIPSQQIRGVPFSLTINARNVNDALIPNYSGSVSLTGIGEAGAVGLTPDSVTLANGKWTGNVTVNTFSNGVRLTADDGTGHLGTSTPFDVSAGPPAKYTWSNIASPQTAGQSIRATIKAFDAGNNPLSSYSSHVLISAPAIERSIGSGTTTSSSFPLRTSNHDERTQLIYLSSELGGGGILTSLSLYVASVPPQTLNNWTIRLKHTGLAAFPGSNWEGSGWTTVYSANQTIEQTGWVTFSFTTPFVYDGVSNLMVDLSFDNSSATVSGSVRTFTATSSRTVFSGTNSTFGDPRTWTGSSPQGTLSSSVPQVKFNAGLNPGIASPTVVFLTNGEWTGDIWVGAAGSGTYLIASDPFGGAGLSNTFSVVAPLDSDVDRLPDSWESNHGLPTDSGVGANGALGDPDADGIPNILEYAFNLNPQESGFVGLPSVETKRSPADNKEYIEFTYRRRIGAPGVTYTVETSSDCVNWTSNSSHYEQISGPLAAGDGVTETIKVRILPELKTPSNSTRFVRVKVGVP